MVDLLELVIICKWKIVTITETFIIQVISVLVFRLLRKIYLDAITVQVMGIFQAKINQVVTYRNHNCQFLKIVFLADLFKQINKILVDL